MGKLEIVCTAQIPEGSSIELEVSEDVDGDGLYENEVTQSLRDGKHKYIIDKLEGSRDNGFQTGINIERSETGSTPSVSDIRLSRPGKTEKSLSEKSIYDMGKQAEFYCDKIHHSTLPETRYYLNGFLNSIYSMDEILGSKDLGFIDWISKYPETETEQELHDYMMKVRGWTTHLGVHADSSLRPPLGHASIIDFGIEGEETGPKESKIEAGVQKEILQFVKVPEEVVEWIESSEDFPEVDSIESVIGDKQAEQRALPVHVLCDAYLMLVASWIGEIEPVLGSIDQIDTVEWSVETN